MVIDHHLLTKDGKSKLPSKAMKTQAVEIRRISTQIYWQWGEQGWLINSIEITQSNDIITKIQIYGFEPLASALIKPCHRNNLWIVNDGDIGETEGLLNALVTGGIVAAPHLRLDGEQAVCKLLV